MYVVLEILRKNKISTGSGYMWQGVLQGLQIRVVKEMKLSNRKLAAHQAKLLRLETQQGFS